MVPRILRPLSVWIEGVFVSGRSENILTKREDILIRYPSKKKEQKQQFLESVQKYVQSFGYPVRIESESFVCRNLVIGNMQQAKYFVLSGTALSGLDAWLEMIHTFPENQRYKVCFVLCDGKRGISSFYRTHGKEIADRLVIYLHQCLRTHPRLCMLLVPGP